MPLELKVPSVGESITEVQIGAWLKRVGDPVRRDESLVEIESDKATAELPSPIDGVLTQVLKQRGEKAQVGETIAYMEEKGAATSSSPAEPAGNAAASTAHPAAPTKSTPAAPAGIPAAPTGKTSASAAADHNGATSAKAEPPTAPVVATNPAAPPVAPQDTQPAPPATPQVPARNLTPAHDAGSRKMHPSTRPARAGGEIKVEPPTTVGADEEVVPMSLLRQRIAERLVEAQQTQALLTTFNEIDMSAVMALRSENRELFQETYGAKLGFMSFFVKATVQALKHVPVVNAEIRGTDVVYRNHYDIGIAVGGGKGLVVPVLRHAERLSFAEIEKAIAEFSQRAQKNQLKVEELQGGTFTISNGGVYGSLLSTPIVNPPQSGILGLHAIQERPVARSGQVVIRPMMYVALTYDHRVVDGRDAVTFLKTVKECVEEPARMLLEL
jgi:2-oxoglutarate dehydrogenase E2 component (dihydrolipoamide succinyltransferase)